MKKILLSALAGLAIIGTVSAQEDSRVIGTTTNKGANILPAAGDFAIGIDAVPFLEYAGNIFTSSHNDAPTFGNDLSKGTVYGKYFLTDKSAVRARATFNFGSNKETFEVQDLTKPTDPDAKVKNTATDKMNNFELGLGYELRRGYGRLQGFYGGEVAFGFEGESTNYTYGNAITATNPGSRPTSVKHDDRRSYVGLGGFAGVEYFVAPKISIGGELGLGLAFGNRKDGKTTTEAWDAASSSVKTETDDRSNNKDNFSYVGTFSSGRIMLSFHF